MNPGTGQLWQSCDRVKLGTHRQVATRFLQRPARQVGHEQNGNIIQHQRRDDFVHTRPDFEQGRDQSP